MQEVSHSHRTAINVPDQIVFSHPVESCEAQVESATRLRYRSEKGGLRPACRLDYFARREREHYPKTQHDYSTQDHQKLSGRTHHVTFSGSVALTPRAAVRFVGLVIKPRRRRCRIACLRIGPRPGRAAYM